MPVSTPLRPLVDALERTSVLDPVAKAYGKAVRGLFDGGAVKQAVSGTWFGHPLHPPLTDVVIGSCLSATLLDLLGGDGKSSERLLAVGIAAAVPTAVAGSNDWSDSEVVDEAVRRVGLVHAGMNVSALALYTASLAARRRGSRAKGTALALAGNAVMTAGGYLGGHMSYVRGVGPNQTAFDPGPSDWTAVGNSSQFLDGAPKAALAGDTPVLVLRHGEGIHAIHNRCTHRGCLLTDGEVEGHVVTCSCHGSQFDVRDGSVLRGPATVGAPAFDTRDSGNEVEIRLRERG